MLLIVSCAYKSTRIESYQTKKVHSGPLLTLVNDRNEIPSTWKLNLVQLPNGKQMDQRVFPYLMRMVGDAKIDGCRIVIASAYRSNEIQISLYNTKCEFYQSQGYDRKTSEKKASQWVFKPGNQLGLSLMSINYLIRNKRRQKNRNG